MILPLRRVCYLNLAAFLRRKKRMLPTFRRDVTWGAAVVPPGQRWVCYLRLLACVTLDAAGLLPVRPPWCYLAEIVWLFSTFLHHFRRHGRLHFDGLSVPFSDLRKGFRGGFVT